MSRVRPKDGDTCGRRFKDGNICRGELVESNRVTTDTGIASKLRCFSCGVVRIGADIEKFKEVP